MIPKMGEKVTVRLTAGELDLLLANLTARHGTAEVRAKLVAARGSACLHVPQLYGNGQVRCKLCQEVLR